MDINRIYFKSRGKIIRGFEHLPLKKVKSPVIIMCHGFTGNCSEHGLFDDFASKASENGYYVLRFDCVGSGSSEGKFAEETSLGGWCDDISSALDFVSTRSYADINKLALIGISMGAAASLLSTVDSRVNAAVGWAPVIYPELTFRKIMSDENWEKLKLGQKVHCSYAGDEFDALPEFQIDAERLSVEKAIRLGGKPIMLRFGTSDQVIDMDFEKRLRMLDLNNVNITVVDGEDHGCMNKEEDNIQETISFLDAVFM